jgi:hypothetical protein
MLEGEGKLSGKSKAGRGRGRGRARPLGPPLRSAAIPFLMLGAERRALFILPPIQKTKRVITVLACRKLMPMFWRPQLFTVKSFFFKFLH